MVPPLPPVQLVVCIARPRNAVMVALDRRDKMKRWALLMEHTVT